MAVLSKRFLNLCRVQSGGCPIPGNVHEVQAGWGSEHLTELRASLPIAGELG